MLLDAQERTHGDSGQPGSAGVLCHSSLGRVVGQKFKE